MNIQFQPNTLYYGDCLDIMANFPEKSVDLICLDPPFNSDRRYNNIFKNSGLKTEAQIKAFDDVWHWDDQSAERVQRLKNAVANPASKVIAGFEGFIPQSKMLSYTSYMAERLFVMHRILKDTGSIYLHCDPYASHYLKLVMDAIFGEKNFRNEIIWHYKLNSISKSKFPAKHDTILYYAVSKNPVFNPILEPYSEATLRRYNHTDEHGRRYKISALRDGKQEKVYMKEGRMVDSVWDIPVIRKKQERLGYPTQKPLALYERIIKASSNEGNLVLDPFAGCGTTIHAAVKNNRKVIGIDILPFALRLINSHRIAQIGLPSLPIKGVPVDYDTATELVKTDPYKFQDWAVSLVDGFAANPQKVSDQGIDGFGMLYHKPDNMDRKAIIVQVTGASGSQLAKYKQLCHDVRKENAAMGILITLDYQSAQYDWKHTLDRVQFGQTTYKPIQCLSIYEYFRNGKVCEPPLKLPPLANPWTGKEMQPTLFDS